MDGLIAKPSVPWDYWLSCEATQRKIQGKIHKQKITNHNETQKESLANAKVSARQQCMYEGPNEEICGKSTQGI